MYSNYQIAQAMLELGRSQLRAGERYHRNWDVVEWANSHLTDHEQAACARIVEQIQ